MRPALALLSLFAAGCGAPAPAAPAETAGPIAAGSSGGATASIAPDDRPRSQGPLADLGRRWPEGSELRFAARWTRDGWIYEGTSQLVRRGVAIEGTIDWRLVRPDPAEGRDLAGRAGDHAVESLAGVFDPTSRTFYLETTGVSDPTLIGDDRYRLLLADDGSIRGPTEGNDRGWRGVLVLTPLP